MINKVILVGNVGADPEVRTLDNGAKYARLRIATTERIYNKEKNESRDITEWHSVTLWRGLADVADKYIRKGSQLYIEGKLRTREYEKNGVKCYATEIAGEEIKILGRREAQQEPKRPIGYQVPTPEPVMPNLPAPDADDLPF